ncbi:APC family permease [Leucobacter luti]|uniref:APC family permease n=1 Tax=Leucobacter luti TaxID=340320 RepID=UPI003CFE02A6
MTLNQSPPAAGHTAAASEPESDHALHRGLGVWSIVSMVAAGAAPLAVVSLTAPLVIALGGSITAPLLFAAAGVILLLFSVGFVTMSKHVRNAGAFYSYIQAGLGRVPGLGSATLALVSYYLLQVGLYAYVGLSFSGMLTRFFDISTPWWIWTAVAWIIVSWLGYRDIVLSAKVLIIALIAEVSAVMILNLSIFVQGGAEGFPAAALNPAGLLDGTPSIGLLFALFCFIGFEATAVFRNEARDPDRTIPRATYITVILVGGLYALSAFAIVMGAGASEALEIATNDTENMTPNLFIAYTGKVVHDLAQILLVTSTFACVLTFHNVLTRYQFTLGSMRVLPERLGAVNPKFRAPSFSSIVVTAITGASVLIVVFTGLHPVDQIYAWFSGTAILGLLTLMTLTSVAVIVYFRRKRGESVMKALVIPAIAALCIAGVIVVALVNITLVIGDPVAIWVLLPALVISFIVGGIMAVRMKRNRPEAYAQLHDEEK